jgi:hypothetical protein
MQDIRSISSKEPCPVLEATQPAAGSLQSVRLGRPKRSCTFSRKP